ncbi:MAG: sensor histidine kinase [Eubacterium sp.]|nr:sensor histidine kinase [Eubacterium sp.]
MNIYVILILALLVIATYLLIRIILMKRSVRNMTEELKFTRDEDYNRQLRVELIDSDINELANEINKNIDYQKNMKLETEKTKRQLEQSISDIAHDLRTPLTVVKGNLQMLEGETLSDKGREYLEISARKAETLKGMVDEFFELSVLESDNSVVEFRDVEVISFLSEIIIEYETLIRDNNLEPEISFPDTSVTIKANREMLSRVFSNLFSNIFKYAEDSFSLNVTKGEDVCCIKLSNKVNPDAAIDVEHIFDRTYRADKARTEGSAGLGLYIAKLLVEKQKGSIEARIENNRLVFEITFAGV